MLSDGVADVNDDGWLMALLEKFQGDDPQALASAILAAGREAAAAMMIARCWRFIGIRTAARWRYKQGLRGGILSLSKLCGQSDAPWSGVRPDG